MMNFKELYEIYWPQWDSNTVMMYVTILLVLTCCTIAIFNSKKFTFVQLICMEILEIYVLLVLFSTVFTRGEGTQFKYELELFWSYRRGIIECGEMIIRDIILNTLMLMPIGIIMPMIYRNMYRKVFLRIILIGFSVSCLIEILQLVLKRGFFEFDDLFHNTLGVIIGYVIYCIISQIILYWKQKRMFK